MKIAYLIIALFTGFGAISQTCPNPGQNPATAFPVCGTSIFTQNTVPLCSGSALPSPQCSADGVEDVNPYWYKFTCFTAGTLGFVITPKDLDDDYDWEVYDVTGRNPNDIYTDGSLVISSNWSGESGLTGASSAGKDLYVCAGPGKALYSKMVNLVLGHDYLLLISHFTQTQSGYDLEFKGGTAVITDPEPPRLKKAAATCGADKIRLSLSKKMKCSTIAADGSDFSITPGVVTVVSARGIGCSSKFDTDSLELVLSGQLPPGNYSLNVKTGSDVNTVLDNCNAGIPVNDSYPIVISVNQPTPMDSMMPLKCAPSEIKLVFKKPIQCRTIARDGTDFVIINGTYPVGILSAAGDCIDGLSSVITLKLDKALVRKGSFTLLLQSGSDGNVLTDECNEVTNAGSSLNFFVKDTVNAGFTHTLYYGCKEDTVDYAHNGNNEVNSWQWSIGDNIVRNEQNPRVIYTVFADKQVRLIVGNGFCSDTSSATITIDNYLKADFEVEEDNCPLEPVLFTNKTVGKIASNHWDFADGTTDTAGSPAHIFGRPGRAVNFTIKYKATDIWGCTSDAEKIVKIYPSCIIDVPNAFTPNGDNINDVFYPLNAVKARQLDFRVYNRWGQQLFSTTSWKQGWDGRYKGLIQPSGVYAWTMRYIDRDTKKAVQRKGMVMLAN